MSSEIAGRFDAWLDDFFVHLFSRRPVDATFAGVETYNDQMPDVSPQGLQGCLEEIRALRLAQDKIPRQDLDAFRKIDFDLAKNFLEMQAWERSSGGAFFNNPVSYTSEAAFALLSLFLSSTSSMQEKGRCLASRLRQLPGFFASAKENLLMAPDLWIDRGIEECKGCLAFLESGIPILRAEENLAADDRLVTEAVAAVRDFSAWMDSSLRRKAGKADRDALYSCGAEAFSNILRWAHGVDIDPLEYADHAEKVIEARGASLAEECEKLGFSTPEEGIARLSEDRTTTQEYLGEFQKQWDSLRELNEKEGLVTWPDFPLEYHMVPRWARAAQPYLYFLNYRCPPRYARPRTFRYNVAPLDLDMPPERQEALLKANNRYVIKTNHVLHHGGVGHHVQNWLALESKSRIAQVSCTDGASRLLMLCSGTLCEGWACYITSVAGARGFLNPLEEFAERAGLRRMAARAVVDARLHCGVFTLEDAIRYYMEKAKMSEAFARSEVVKNSLFPGGAIMYLLGVEQIERLRQDMETLSKEQGTPFSLKAFHDEFLSYGGIPVARIAREMKEKKHEQ
jgi:hypothetical protein